MILRVMSFCLDEGLPPRLPAGISFGLGPGQGENAPGDERVVDDDIGLAERVIGQKRQQARRAGAGADEPDRTRREFGQLGCIEPGEMAFFADRAQPVDHACPLFANDPASYRS